MKKFHIYIRTEKKLSLSFLSDKLDITKHKNYKLLEYYDKRNLFDVEEYLTNRDKVKLKSSYKINRLNI